MSLSEQNRALDLGALKNRLQNLDRRGGLGYEAHEIVRDTINTLDAIARAEGVAALQQAGEPVAWAMLQRDGSVLRVQAEPLHEGFAQMMATDCGCTVQALGPLSPLPQQTALVEEGVEKIIAPHEPAACGASAPSEAPRSDGGEA